MGPLETNLSEILNGIQASILSRPQRVKLVLLIVFQETSAISITFQN